jgi:hypothetical protein
MSSAASDPFDEQFGEHSAGSVDPVDDGPVFGERRRRIIRMIVLVALVGMLLPLVLSAFSVARSAAERACAVYVADFDADAAGARVAFDLFAEGGPGWLCYDVRDQGGDRYLGNLGLMPALPRPSLPGERSA